MKTLIAVIVLMLLLGLAMWLKRRIRPNRPGEPLSAAGNRLETLLARWAQESEPPAELRDELLASDVLALCRADDPQTPMTFSASVPAELAGEGEAGADRPDGQVEFGPYVLCFSSPAIVEQLQADRVIGLLLRGGRVGPLSIRRLIRFALDSKTDLLIDPFFEMSRRISLDQMRRTLDGPPPS
jgi:hypothetical protein